MLFEKVNKNTKTENIHILWMILFCITCYWIMHNVRQKKASHSLISQQVSLWTMADFYMNTSPDGSFNKSKFTSRHTDNTDVFFIKDVLMYIIVPIGLPLTLVAIYSLYLLVCTAHHNQESFIICLCYIWC